MPAAAPPTADAPAPVRTATPRSTQTRISISDKHIQEFLRTNKALPTDATPLAIADPAFYTRSAHIERGDLLERLVLISRLKPNAKPLVAELIAVGPPYELEQSGFQRHSIYLSEDDVVFMFEADEVEWLADELVYSPFHWMLTETIEKWRPLVENPERAREKFFWERAPETGQEA